MQALRIPRVSKHLSTETIEPGTASNSAIAVGARKPFLITNADQVFMKLGATGVTAAATDILIPQAGSWMFDTGHNTHVSFWNATAANVVVSVTSLANV